MRKFQVAFIAFVASTALATAACAQDSSGFYGNIGYQSGDYGAQNSAYSRLGKGLDALDLGIRLPATKYISIEGDAGFGMNSKTTSIEGVSVKSKLENTLGLYGVFTYPVYKDFEIFARGGFSEAKGKVSAAGLSDKVQSSGLAGGVGVRYFPGGGKNGVELAYNHADFGYDGQSDVGQLSFVHRF